jgi:hypothetical protein
MGLFKDLKIKETLSMIDAWEYDKSFDILYYKVDDEHTITISFNGFRKKTVGDNFLINNSSNNNDDTKEEEKCIIVNLIKVGDNLNGGIILTMGTPILTHTMKLYSKNYLLVKKLRKIRKPLYKKYVTELSKECSDTNKRIKDELYQAALGRVPDILKRELTINLILNTDE